MFYLRKATYIHNIKTFFYNLLVESISLLLTTKTNVYFIVYLIVCFIFDIKASNVPNPA